MASLSCLAFSKNSYADYIEVDGGQYNGVEQVQQLINIAKLYPVYATKYRLILLDEAHRLSNQAWDSLLKLLEEGKTKTIFMFATTEGDKIRKAIHSRSLVFQMKPLSVKEIANELFSICDREKIAYDKPSILSIAYQNNGKMRDALKTLDMFYRSFGEVKDISLVTTEEKFIEILLLIHSNDIKTALDKLDELIINKDNLSQSLTNALTSIYCYPQNKVSEVPDHILQRAKTLLSYDLKKVIVEFMTYKPQTYEQIKLFLFILADVFANHSNNNRQTTQGRRLLKRQEVSNSVDNNELEEF